MLASGLLPDGVNCSASESQAFLGVWIGQEYCESAVLQELRNTVADRLELAGSREFQVACMALPVLPLDRPTNVTIRLQAKDGSVHSVRAGTVYDRQVALRSAFMPALSQSISPLGQVVNTTVFLQDTT